MVRVCTRLETKSQEFVPAPYLVDCIFIIEFFLAINALKAAVADAFGWAAAEYRAGGVAIFVSLVIVFQFARRLYRSLYSVLGMAVLDLAQAIRSNV